MKKMADDAPFEERADAVGQRWLDDAFLVPPSAVPSCIYHYTDAAGLKGTLDHGVLWATDHRFLNDKNELSHLRDAVRNVLIEECRSNASDTVKDLCRATIHYADIESVHEIFIFSMSAKSDDLSQWRGYAREGRGFTIGLDGGKLIKEIDAFPYQCAMGKVEYNHTKQINAIHRVIKEIDDEVIQEIARNRMPRDEVIDHAARTLDAIVEIRAAISKYSSFASENEWRVVAMLSRKKLEHNINVRTSGDRLVPYVELKFGKAKLPLSRIGIEPGFAGTQDVDAVRRLCANNGYDPDLYFANTPYRRL